MSHRHHSDRAATRDDRHDGCGARVPRRWIFRRRSRCPDPGDPDADFLDHEGDLDGAEAEGPDPGSWRYPLCHGPIVRMYLKRERVDPRTGDPRSPNGPGEPAVRAGFRCRRSVCGWNDWVMWFMSEQ